jgi:hypothetical protein
MGVGDEVTGSNAVDPLPLSYEPRRIRRRCWPWCRELWAWVIDLRGLIRIAAVVALILTAITAIIGFIAYEFFPDFLRFYFA